MTTLAHKHAPFDDRHPATPVPTGEESELPGLPEGVGDQFITTDTEKHFVSLDGDTWTNITPEAGGGGGGFPEFLGAKVNRGSSQTLGTNGFINVQWQTELFDYGDFIDLGDDDEVFTIPEDGVYQLSAEIQITSPSASAGNVQVRWSIVAVGGIAPTITQRLESGSLAYNITLTTTLALSEGAQVVLQVERPADVSISVAGQTTGHIHKIGETPE